MKKQVPAEIRNTSGKNENSMSCNADSRVTNGNIKSISPIKIRSPVVTDTTGFPVVDATGLEPVTSCV